MNMRLFSVWISTLAIIFTGAPLAFGVEPMIPDRKIQNTNTQVEHGKTVAECRTQFNDAGFKVQLFEKGVGKWSMHWSELSNAGTRRLKKADVNVEPSLNENGDCVLKVKSKDHKNPQVNLTFKGKDPHANAVATVDFVINKKIKIENKVQNASFPLDCGVSEEVVSKYVGCEKPKPKPLFQVVPKDGAAVFERAKPKPTRPLFDVQKKRPSENGKDTEVESTEDMRLKLLPE